MLSVTVKAPAKVNWHLKICSKLSNGYHTIVSVFQKISLNDVMQVTLVSENETASQKEKVVGLEKCVEKGKSTVDKAIKLWKKKTKCKYEIYINVQKNIPAKSGLGGGSSDAASVLLALNTLDKRLSFSELLDLALSIGCDVPFFLHNFNAACVFGMGEIVMPIEERHDLHGFLIFPKEEKMSTKNAFESFDKLQTLENTAKNTFESTMGDSFENTTIARLKTLSQEYTKPYINWNYKNDFEIVKAIGNTKPQIKLLEDERLFLTGSGNCWVLLSNRKTLEIEDCTVMPFST